ncbi:MAG TPA: FAD-linked oxidase C-terminal domain-containing protein [Tepidisphaeraceae bacterium]|jgi:FAD/FMN-containing dehydrogenase/Fe-S oxidoreductase
MNAGKLQPSQSDAGDACGVDSQKTRAVVSLPQLSGENAAPAFRSDNATKPGLAQALSQILRGQVRFGEHDRRLYATDASPYQVKPIGVVIPADAADAAAVLDYCARHGVPVLPRGGGTSLAGQCTNVAVVIDLSPSCRKLISVDLEANQCHVEAGITLDELNRQLVAAAPGLFYAPDPATAGHATVGGCIGNNAAGSRSIRYGRTSENVSGVEILLTSGERLWLEAGAGTRDPAALRLARGVAEIVLRHADLIRSRFAKTVRRNAGYGLDLILQQLDQGISAEDLDLSGLICGSEGTLALVLSAKLKLHPIRVSAGLAVASFATLEEAIDAVNPILTTRPSAVELLDDVVLRAALGNPTCRPYLDLLPRVIDGGGGRAPAAVLYVEYQENSLDEVESGFARLKETLPGVIVSTYTNKAAMAEAWTLRKSGEALLHGLPGKRKPQTFVEDNAVPVENLPRFVRKFKQIVARHGTEAAYWAHASVGVLHVRPMLDLNDDADLVRMKQIAIEVADLARECGGVMSGEHGDGRVRGPLLERFYGSELVGAFAEVKRLFDPVGILNPGNIVNAGGVDTITDHLREFAACHKFDGHAGHALKVPEKRSAPSVETFYDYGDQDDFGHAVEQCNGAGFCRKTAGGTMCPSYRGTLDERHSTRGRGNALRHAIRVGLGDGTPAWNDAETMETLDLCLSCKACKSECPSNVDVARLKAEYLAQSWKHRKSGAPLKARVFGHVRALNQLGSLTPRLSNYIGTLRPVRAVMNRVLKLAPQRSLPAFAPSLYRWFKKSPQRSAMPPGRPKVVLYADCFATYNEPHVGRAAVRVLEALGYAVELPQIACCGRAMISTGLLPAAIASADSALRTLEAATNDPDVKAVVVCEPSCLSAITDDWLQLKLQTPLEQRKRLAAKSYLVEDFVDQFWEAHPQRPAIKDAGAGVILHGHCHQKALSGDQSSARLLRRLTGGNLEVLPSGCCGMAGSFGYAADKYDVSMAIGELSLFPPLRAADASTIVCAPGTSCRHQIHDGTKRRALHPIELAERLLCD